MTSMDQDESNKRRRVGKVWGVVREKGGYHLFLSLLIQSNVMFLFVCICIYA